ncbi:MAG: hypothetical protein ACRD0O_00655 [Acidimicrobiia bacterium]
MAEDPWREALAQLESAIPPSQDVLDSLTAAGWATIAEAPAIQLRMLQPLPARPRLSPSSLILSRLAHHRGCLYFTSGLREGLRSPVELDHRWQTEYLQQHPVIQAAGPADANVETHDLLHAMLGVGWWPGISVEDFYVASRLSEAVAAYHYYFLDQVFEPRCAPHEAVVDLGRIWKFNCCNACNREDNLFFNLTPPRAAAARALALECALQGEAFLRHELAEIGRELSAGTGFIRRNPVNLADNAGDAFRYARYTHPFLAHQRMEPYLSALRPDQLAPSFAEYLFRAGRIVRAITGTAAVADSAPDGLRFRRQTTVIQDLLLRLGTVLVQHDVGARPLGTATLRAVEEVVEDVSAIDLTRGCRRGMLAPEVAGVFTRLAEEPGPETRPLFREIGAVGYDLWSAMTATPPPMAPGEGQAEPDVTHIEDQLLASLAPSWPRTVAYLGGQGLLGGVAAAFRSSPERWSRVEATEVDGRAPLFEALLQRVSRLVERMATEGQDGKADSLAVAAELGRVELEYLRYQVRSAPHLDMRGDPEVTGGTEHWVRLAPTTVFLPSWLNIAAPEAHPPPAGVTGPQERPHLYVLSVAGDCTHLTRLGPEGVALRRELADPQPWCSAVARLTRALSTPAVEAERLLAGCARLGVIQCFIPARAASLTSVCHG